MPEPIARRSLIVGLTGNIGAGKSTVLHYFEKKGAHVIDADQLTRAVQQPDGLAYNAIVEEFGREILNADGSIARSALGKIVFNDGAKLARLEQIVHPAVLRLAEQRIANTSAPLVIIEAIKLLESNNLIRLCDEIWVVTISRETQIRRLVEQRGMDEAEVHRRLSAQSAQDEKVRRAQRVIDNDGSPEQLYTQLDRIWIEVTERGADESKRVGV